MRIILKQPVHLVLLILTALLQINYGQSSSSAKAGQLEPTRAESAESAESADPWTLVPAYSWSLFNKGRSSWRHESLDLYYYLAEPQLLLGASVDRMHRPPNGEDIVYGLNARSYAFEDLELYGAISLTDDADFLPSERYSLGLQYKHNPDLAFLFDVEHMTFGSYAPMWDDDITQISPGVSYWFTEHTFMTVRYTHGWVHEETDYDYYSAAVHFGDLPRDGQLSLGLAYGTDPDLDFGSNSTTLSDTYTFSIFYREPINSDLTVFAGLEYVYRLRAENDDELYQMWTPTIGLSWKF